MEEEQRQVRSQQEIARIDLILIIKNAFNSTNLKQQKEAQQTISTLLKSPGFFQKLCLLLTCNTDIPKKNQLDKAAAVLIKKYSYDFSKSTQNKKEFIEMLFTLIICQKIDFGARELLGIGLEYQFNEDQGNLYRQTVIDKVLQMLQNKECLGNFEGLLIVCFAYLNSLVEVEDQIEFFQCSIGNVNFAALSLLKEMEKIPFQEWVLRDKIIIPKIAKLFEYIETAIERLIDQQMYFVSELTSISSNTFLISTLQSYLQIFNNNGSLISLAYPQINNVKRMMISIISLLYSSRKCPQKIFNTIYMTFLIECQYTKRDCNSESILISCMELLSLHLANKFYYKIYNDNLSQTILALFMYSTTSEQEYQALNNNPEQFSDIAEYYSCGDEKYYNLKVKASNFLIAIADKIDGAISQLLQFLILIMTSSLEHSSKDSEIMNEVKSEAANFNFYGLTNEQKLETSMMILCALSPFIHRRQDANQIIYAFFISQHDILMKVTSPIVILRQMRVISYFSINLYFGFIEAQIKRGKVFMVEAFRCFQKILKSNKFAEMFNYLANIMAKLVDEIHVTDSLMQLIIINNYDTMIKVSPQLFHAILKRLKDQFYINKSKDEHATLIVFNFIYALVKKEKRKEQFFQLQQIFFEFAKHLSDPNNKQYLNKYDQKLVELTELLLTKVEYIPEQIESFVMNSLSNVSALEKGTQYFRFYSLYIFKLSGSTYKLQPLFTTFWNEAKRRHQIYLQTKFYNESSSYFYFLMSQIMANYCRIDLTEQDLKKLLSIAQTVPAQQRQYPLMVFLTHMYLLPYPVCTFLRQNNIYEGFLNGVIEVQFEGKLIKRILLLALIKLLEIQDNATYFIHILVCCINHLKKQCFRPNNFIQNFTMQPRPRKLLEEIERPVEQNKQSDKNDNELVNLFVKFYHPFSSLSEYDQFKVIFWQNDQHVNQLTPQMKADLKMILQTEWVDNKTRRIVHIKK